MEISRARDKAELVTDDKAAPEAGRDTREGTETVERTRGADAEKVRAPKSVEREFGL